MLRTKLIFLSFVVYVSGQDLSYYGSSNVRMQSGLSPRPPYMPSYTPNVGPVNPVYSPPYVNQPPPPDQTTPLPAYQPAVYQPDTYQRPPQQRPPQLTYQSNPSPAMREPEPVPVPESEIPSQPIYSPISPQTATPEQLAPQPININRRTLSPWNWKPTQLTKAATENSTEEIPFTLVYPLSSTEATEPLKPQPYFAPMPLSTPEPTIIPEQEPTSPEPIIPSHPEPIEPDTTVPLYVPPRPYQPIQTPWPNYLPHPPRPNYLPQPPRPNYLPQTPSPNYLPQTPSPNYLPQTPSPNYLPQTPSPNYLPQTPSPNYLPQTPSPNYLPQTPSPNYLPQTPSPNYLPHPPRPNYLPQTPWPNYLPQPHEPVVLSAPTPRPETARPNYQPLPPPAPVRPMPVIQRPSPLSTNESLLPPTSYPKPVQSQPPPQPTASFPVLMPTSNVPDPEITDSIIPALDFECSRGNGYYPIVNECDSYIECESKRAYKHSCPDGLHFNSQALYPEYPCAYPSEVKCESSASKHIARPTSQCPNWYGFFSEPGGDCSKYIMCQKGSATLMNCPFGLVFNEHLSSCDWPENVPQCNPNAFKNFTCPIPPEDDPDDLTRFRYGSDCSMYVACQRGQPRLLRCDPGMSFDENSQVCMYTELVPECRRPIE